MRLNKEHSAQMQSRRDAKDNGTVAMFDTFTFDWRLVVVDLIRMLIAFALAFPLAWERGKSARNLGLRTFPIVAVASCGYVLVGERLANAEPETLARVLQGLLSGIGFIGGGAILKEGGNVRGLATAASIWSTGAIGAAVALRREEVAVVLSVVNFALLRLLTPLANEQEDRQ